MVLGLFKKSFLTTKDTKPTFAKATVGKKAQSTQRLKYMIHRNNSRDFVTFVNPEYSGL